MFMTDHTARAFDAELRDLQRMISEMGGLAEQQVSDAMEALSKQDTTLAQKVIEVDRRTDILQRDIEEKAVLTIARRQPMAIDLREIVAAMRLSIDLERVGDLAKNIAKRVVALGHEGRYPTLMRGIEHMAELVLAALKQVLDAYAQRDVEAALLVWRGDEAIDAVNNALYRSLLTCMMEDPRNIGFFTHLLFCAKNIERMGDHATNIAETVHYMVRGQVLAEERPKGDTTSLMPIPFAT
jgi:phosphate transport system protein